MKNKDKILKNEIYNSKIEKLDLNEPAHFYRHYYETPTNSVNTHLKLRVIFWHNVSIF